MTAPTFEGRAVVELLGHRIRYGRVSEVTLFGEAFCKVEMPTEPPTVEYYSGKALYGIRPASEDAIRAYHAPRKALSAAAESWQGGDSDEFDDDPPDAHDDEGLDEPRTDWSDEPDGPTSNERTGGAVGGAV